MSNHNAPLGTGGKIVVITGASRGIGKAIADIFARNGHDLLISSRNEVALYKAMEELQTKYPGVAIKAKAFDLSDKQQAKDLGNWCLKYAVPDILVNNAGLFEPGSIHNEPEGLLENQLATNVHSAYHLTRTVLPKMMERRSGHIFNMCSIASLHAYHNGGSYSISKYALLTRISGTAYFKHQFPRSFACCLSERSNAFAFIATPGYFVCNSSMALYKATSFRLLIKRS